MELDYLRVFYEVTKAGSFTEAALKLHISQSALSRSVALLEKSQDVKLLERSKQGVSLTTTGLEVFRHCEQIFQTVNRIEAVCRATHEECEGRLWFGCADHIANYLLPEPLRAFRDEFPRVIPAIELGTPDELLEKLIHTECEFSLAFAKATAPQIVFETLREEPMALVVQADLWRKTSAPNNVERVNRILDKVGYISSVGVHGQNRPSRVLKELFGRMPPVRLELNGQEAQKRMCLAGGGLAYLSKFMVAREIASGELQSIDVEEPHSFKLWLAMRRGHELSVPAKTFIERLRRAWG